MMFDIQMVDFRCKLNTSTVETNSISKSSQLVNIFNPTPYKIWKCTVQLHTNFEKVLFHLFFFVQTYSAQFYVTVVICSNQLSTAVVKSNSLQLLKHIFTTSCSRWKWCIKLLSLCENSHPHPRGIFTFYIPGLCFEYHFLFRYNNFTLFLEGGGEHYMDGGDIQYHIFLAPDFQTQRLMYTWCELADTKSILVYVLLVTN